MVITTLLGVEGELVQRESMFQGQVGALQSVTTSPSLLGDFKQGTTFLGVMRKL